LNRTVIIIRNITQQRSLIDRDNAKILIDGVLSDATELIAQMSEAEKCEIAGRASSSEP
jgi:hypothetical protein